MNLKKMLSKNSILPNLLAETKEAAIEELIDFLAENNSISDRDAALQAALNREAKMSTGMQNGIAIPHGKTDAVSELLVAIAIKPGGIDFDAMDGQPCTIFIMTLSPEHRVGPHIQFLAEISKLLGNKELREKLVAAGSAEEILHLLTD
ncbi:MAG: PTS sugar transporter subunit IIA [Kiritimatiellales bacterium]|nr:PTS sugar transporter subunit IIA [Kiritimatiellota bacterium]MBL7011366.1 PTS sugar transporter subunit IIA [Kiritimatiellales bacterium]